LARNPSAIHLIEARSGWDSTHKTMQHPELVDWLWLGLNPNAIHLLEANPHRIDWTTITRNPSAIEIIEANQNKICWPYMALNPAMFAYDYKQMKANQADLHQALIQELFHPRRIQKHLESGEDLDDYLL